jgi:2,5-diketo-D-gluconate reductase A
MTVPTILLNSGESIPQLGFGVFKVDPGETERIVSDALETGYRHIDTAKAYDNEEGVGAAVASSGIERDELYITTKLWNSDQQRQSALDAFDLSLEKLKLDYVDLYLIHWPSPHRGHYLEAWESLQEIAESGRARSVGVSNFKPHHLQKVLDLGGLVPAVNQIEFHPDFQQRESAAFNAQHGIVTESWSPLGQGALVDDAGVAAIAQHHGKSLAQIILRWHIQIGHVVIPKSNRKERMAENLDIFDFELSDDELAAITALDKGDAGRKGSDPDTATF